MATAINNKGLLDVCKNCGDGVTPVIEYSFNTTSKVLTVTDASSFAADDTFKVVNIKVTDKFGHVFDEQITVSSGSKAIDLSDPETFNLTEGFNILATVVSTNHQVADVAVYDVYKHAIAGSMTAPESETQTPVEITGVTVVPDDKPEIAKGDTLQFNAAVLPLNAPQGVTWGVKKANGSAAGEHVTIDITGKITTTASADSGDYKVTATSIADNTKDEEVEFTIGA